MSLRSRRRFLALFLAACFGLAVPRVVREFRDTLKPSPEQRAWRDFLRECAAAIPADGGFYLFSSKDPSLSSGELYPRRVRVVDAADLPELRVREPDAWFVRIPDPFERRGAFLGRFRDLP